MAQVALSSAQEEMAPEETSGLVEGESAASVVAPTMVSWSETEDESTTTMETLMDSVEVPIWSDSAQTASLTHVFTALTLAGVPVTNTTMSNILKSL